MKNTNIDIIQDVLLDIGIPANLLGFRYICHAEQIALKTGSHSLRNLSNSLYMDIAAAYATTPGAVDKSIKNAIVCAWKHGDAETIKHIFKNSVNPRKGVPTNSQFLMRIYHYILNS